MWLRYKNPDRRLEPMQWESDDTEIIDQSRILGVGAICRPPDLNGKLSVIVPLIGDDATAEIKDGDLRLHLTDSVADQLERLLQVRRERGI
jgi:hypothetical protein